MKAPRVAILLNNFNGLTMSYKGRPIIDLCLEALKNTEYKNYTVVVVDDHSADDSVAHVLGRFKGVAVIRNRGDYGLARSINSGIKFALKECSPKYLLLMANDVMVKDGASLGSMVDLAESDERIGIVGCKLLYPNGLINNVGFRVTYAGLDIADGVRDRGQYDVVEDRQAFPTDVLLIKRAVIERAGLFDGKFYMSHDDLDYCMRARDVGFRVVYDGHAELTHIGSFTLRRKRTPEESMMWFYYRQRNVMYFALKHLSAPRRAQALLHALAGGLITVRGKAGIRFKERPLVKLRTALRAYADAYALYKGSWGQPDYTDGQFEVVRGI